MTAGGWPSWALRSAARMTAALPGMSRRRARLRAALTCARVSFAARAGSGALPSSSSASEASRSAKASSAAGKYSRSWWRSRRGLPGPLPDQRLTGTRHHLDRLRVRAVARHGVQLAGIGAHHIGQHVRVTAVALGAGDPVTFPVPRGLQRVHPVDRVPGRDQRADPRAAVGPGPGHHLRIIGALAQLLPDQLMQPGHPGHPLRQPPAGQHPAPLVHQLHVMMIPRPSHRLRTSASILPPEMPDPVSSLRENNQRPDETVLTPPGAHDIPAAINSPGHREGHGLFTGLQVRLTTVLTCRRPPANESARTANPLTLISGRSAGCRRHEIRPTAIALTIAPGPATPASAQRSRWNSPELSSNLLLCGLPGQGAAGICLVIFRHLVVLKVAIVASHRRPPAAFPAVPR